MFHFPRSVLLAEPPIWMLLPRVYREQPFRVGAALCWCSSMLVQLYVGEMRETHPQMHTTTTSQTPGDD
jgi:hypothetical protein